MNHVKISAIFCALIALLSACAKSSNSSKTTSSFQSTNQFSAGYTFTGALGGCTIEKTFNGPSADNVQKQMCEALQDHSFNDSCAEPSRKEFFAKNCPGYVWTPKYADGDARPSVRDQDKEYRIRESLAYMVVENYEVSADLSSSEARTLKKLMSDSQSCTMSYVGPRCLDLSIMHGTPVGSFHDLGERNVFVVELNLDNLRTPFLYVFDLNSDGTAFKSSSFQIYKQNRPFPGPVAASQTVQKYFASKSSATLVARAALAPDTIAAALERINTAEDAREAYHMAKLVVQEAPAEHAARAQLPEALIARKEMIASSNFPEHQSRLISLLANDAKTDRRQMIDFCDGLVSASDPSVNQMAAVYLLANDTAREQVKPLVRAALNHAHWNIRRIAVYSLSGANPSAEDQNLILSKLQDSDADVRAEVTKAAEKMTLSSTHVATLSSLTKAGTWETRREATRLLGLIADGSADDSLITQINDDDGDIRTTAFEALNARALDEGDVPALAKIFSSKSWKARLDAAKLLGKIKGQAALKALEDQLAKETDADVKQQLTTSISAVSG